MKRWQDRGEVADSDEEELDLSIESPSEEPAKKRPRLSPELRHAQDGPRGTTRSARISAVADNEDEIAKVATANGRKKGKLVRPSAKAQAVHMAPVELRESDNSVPMVPAPSDAALYLTIEQPAEAHVSGDHKHPKATAAFLPTSSVEPPTTTQPLCTDDGATAFSEDELPGVSQILEASRQQDRAAPNRSLSSSPLSERSVSPPAALFTAKSFKAASEVPAHSETAEAPQESLHGMNVDAITAPRSLRTRKDIQLHPYLLEKAKYQKQFKERGLKPVRLVQPDSQLESEGHQSDHGSSQAERHSSPASSGQIASPGVFDTPRTSHVRFESSPRPLAHDPSRQHRLPKRRKIDHEHTPGRLSARHSSTLLPQLDYFSIPPSPPWSSGDAESQEPRRYREAASTFKLPQNLSPLPMPTPAVSSEAKRQSENGSPATDSPPRTARRLRRTTRDESTPLASSSSEAESEAEIEAQRLRREQKRIRGVLPASWLKIDFQQQRPRRSISPSGTRRLNERSPEEPEKQKGLARRVIGARPRAGNVDNEPVMSDGGDSDESDQLTNIVHRQSTPGFGRHQLHAEPPTTVDDDVMENDFVDAMLAGPSRRAKQGSRSYQPRITAVFGRKARQTHYFSEERFAGSGGMRLAVKRNVQTSKRRRSQHERQKRPPVLLSIIDAPESPDSIRPQMPDFVRLALRQSRRAPNRGRHSPTSKIIRLATTDDTAEVDTVLRAWCHGKIAFRGETKVPQSDAAPRDTSARNEPTEVTSTRTPLSDLSDNSRAARHAAPTDNVESGACCKRPSYLVPKAELKQSRKLHREAVNASQSRNSAGSEPTARHARTHVRSPLRRNQPTLRTAQLETLQRQFDMEHREQVFERRMQCLTENIATRGGRVRTSETQLARYLYSDNTRLRADSTGEDQPATLEINDGQNQLLILPHRPRKAQARRINTQAREYRQPSELADNTALELDDDESDEHIPGPILQGLGPFGTRYSLDFDVKPLELGTCFQSNTIVGSGELYDALNLSHCDLDHQRGRMQVRLADEDGTWEIWNEDVATGFSRVSLQLSNILQDLDKIPEATSPEQYYAAIDHNANYLLRSVSRYCSNCLHFADPVDRRPCAESICRLVDELSRILVEQQTDGCQVLSTVIRIRQYMVIMLAQAKQIADHPSVEHTFQEKIALELRRSASSLAKHVVADRFDELREDYEHSQSIPWTEGGSSKDAWALSSVVILNNALQKLDSHAAFWVAIRASFPDDIHQYRVTGDFEKQWKDLFTILPALDIDSRGVVQRSARCGTLESWKIPKQIMHRIFELYEASSRVRGFSVNDYVRLLLSRCHHLIDKWHWWKCEPILNTVYDFFAHRSLGFLHNEEGRGSPKFLEDLSLRPLLEPMPSDRSFHIFLKMLAKALLDIRENRVYDERRVGALIWRFIPSHGRIYQKDIDLKQVDLDALQNHHDLLVVLYYALPPSQRPKVSLIRDLVDHNRSHRKACDVSVRSWTNLATFQSSTSEPLKDMRLLSEWYVDFIRTTIAQYRLAKSEADQDFAKAMTEGALVSDTMLQATIANNQRLIAATLTTALAGLKRALLSAISVTTVHFLTESTQFWAVLELFDPSQRRLLNTMVETLQIMDTALDMEAKLSASSETQVLADDSQEFGDFSALQEFVAHDDTSPGTNSTVGVADILLIPMGQFLSNVFGADSVPEDSLLQRAIDVWIRIAGCLVKTSKRSWTSFVDEYSTQSWAQMRATPHWRKYTPYFMARVIQEPSLAEDEVVRQKVLGAWMLSLVEREASLKFQHVLTTALLNHCSGDPLLWNLPFSQQRSARHHVSLDELRQRRLPLLSSLLSNMRKSLDAALYDGQRHVQAIRSSHAALLRQLMQAMKQHYQELQTDGDCEVADGTAQGSYVEFVQHVVSYLQQHTGDICKVDPFFTDSNAFPLPARDPTYVVGKLKGYATKLCEAKSRKELAVFIYNVSERAAVDGQQQYLAEQLAAATAGPSETASQAQFSLRHVLLTSIFPTYIDNALEQACGWILVMPILHACKQVVADIVYDIQLEDDNGSILGATSVTAMLLSIHRQFQYALAHPELLGHATVMHLQAAMFDVCSSALPLASSLHHTTPQSSDLLLLVRALSAQATVLQQHLSGLADLDHLDPYPGLAEAPHCWLDTKDFVEKQIRDSLWHWQALDGQYFVRRGCTSKEVIVRLDHVDNVRKRLQQITESFEKKYEATFAPRQRHRQVAHEDACGLSELLI